MIDFKPGQTIKCTVKRVPRGDARDTIARLMRFDPAIKRSLKKAQNHRMRTLIVRSRGKRPWAVRRKAARHAVPSDGATWTMTWFPHVRPDFESVEQYLAVEAA